jgi:hypothetical protein
MGYWCSLTIFFSYKYTTEGEDILITFVFPLILTRPEKKSQGRHFAFIISIKYLFINYTYHTIGSTIYQKSDTDSCEPPVLWC